MSCIAQSCTGKVGKKIPGIFLRGEKKYLVSFFLLCFLHVSAAVFASCASAASPVVEITVNSGRHCRTDAPVSIVLEGAAAASPRLVETTGNRRLDVPCQIDKSDPPRLWWILSGETPAGAVRRYRLLDDPNGPGPAASGDLAEALVTDSFVQLQVGSAAVLRYHHKAWPPPAGKNGRYRRSAFIHPLWSPAGTVLTDVQPPDHYHHMGIWMPWTKTVFDGRKIDFWNLGRNEGTVRFKRYDRLESGPVYASFTAEHEHVDRSVAGGEKVILNEKWTVRLYNIGGLKDGYRLWDIESVQRCAAGKPLKILQHRYGGLGFRGRRSWQGDNCDYLTSEGKTRVDAHATRARWCDVYGRTATGIEGVTIFSHPENFRHPEPMRIWPEGHIFFNFAPAQIGDFDVEPGRDYVFRYRFYVHSGRITSGDAERIWRDYAQPPTAAIEGIKSSKTK